MARKRYTTEQIIGVLREAEVKLSQGESYRLKDKRKAGIIAKTRAK